jgi:hypothetical protein
MKLKTLTFGISIAYLMLSCNPKEILEPADSVNFEFSIVNGDTVRTEKTNGFEKIKTKHYFSKNEIFVGDTIVVFKEPKFHTKPSKLPNLNNLKNNEDPLLKGKPLRYVAIGGSTAAGYRDGGWFNEGIATSYPNLLSIQLGINNFKQPYFDANEYNGYGRRVPTKINYTGGPIQKFKEANNNLAVRNSDKFEMKPFTGSLDNFAIPMLYSLSYYDGRLTNANTSNNSAKASFKRVVSDGNYHTKIFDKNNNFDFVTIDFGLNEYYEEYFGLYPGDERNGYKYNSTEKIINQLPGEYEPQSTFTPTTRFVSSQLAIARKLEEFGVKKAVILNMPDPTFTSLNSSLPIEKFNAELYGSKILYIQNSVFRLENEKFFKSNSTIDSLLGKNVNINLKKGLSFERPLTMWPFGGSKFKGGYAFELNDELKFIAKRFGWALVDIEKLYIDIFESKYVSWDGVKVSKELFYSTDGLFPSALGNAVIANEIIKTTNSFYKTDIQQISIKEYLPK